MARTKEARKADRVVMKADDARQYLGDVIDRACFKGERFVLTRHGKEVVAVVSIADLEKIETA